jgi:hypothetical protein
MMKCKDIEKNLILYYYDEIDPSAKVELSSHLETCTKCKSSWDQLKTTLDVIKIKEPELSESFWQNYLSKVHERVEGKKSHRYFPLLLKPRFAQVIVTVVILLIIGFGGFKFYISKKEDTFIRENYELIKNLELFENFEILRHLDEIEGV